MFFKKVFFFSVILFIISALGCEKKYHVENKKDPIILSASKQNFDESARFIAGMNISKSSKLYASTQLSVYKKYKRNIDISWNRFQKKNIHKMLKWRKKHLPNQYKKTIFYPFSGPDILHGLTFYPQGTDFLMFGLEKIGHIPDPLSMDRKRRLRDLRGLPVALNFILNHNFFITRYMLKRIGRTSYSGITGVMMFFLARNGYTIKDVKKFVLNDGRLYYKTKLVSPQKNKDLSRTPETVNGVEIIFYKNKKQLRRLRFVKINIENKSKQIDNFLDFLQTYPSMSTMIKSASYLMHLKSFSKIRNAILKKSVSVLEDDSGIPYRKFDKNVWKISYFGKYHVPIRVFKGFTQKDLSRAIDKHSPGLLPFSYGYGFKFIDMTYHLIYAQKKSYVKSLSAKK